MDLCLGRAEWNEAEVDLVAVHKLVGWSVLGGVQVVHDGRNIRAGAELPIALWSGVFGYKMVTASRVDGRLHIVSHTPRSDTHTEEDQSTSQMYILTTAQ
jgi:hypothetical protein